MCRLLVQSHIRTCQPHFGVITCFLQKTARSVCEHHTTLRKLSSSRLSSVQSVETSAWIIAQSVQLISWRLFSMLAEFGCFVHGNACFSLIESPLYKFVTADNSLVWSTSYIPTITCWQLLECVVHPWNTSIQRPSGGMSYIHFNTSQESGLSLSLSCPATQQVQGTPVKSCPSPWDPGEEPHSQNSALLFTLAWKRAAVDSRVKMQIFLDRRCKLPIFCTNAKIWLTSDFASPWKTIQNASLCFSRGFMLQVCHVLSC